MPRAHLSKRLPDAEAIRLFAEHHIVQVRRRKNGEILDVKHAALGWLSPQAYYGLQKMHDLPLGDLIRAGYQLKAFLWSFKLDVLGVSLPLGGSIPAAGLWNHFSFSRWADYFKRGEFPPEWTGAPPTTPEKFAELERAFRLYSYIWLAAVLLPFGDLLIVYQMMKAGWLVLNPDTSPKEGDLLSGLQRGIEEIMGLLPL